MNGTILEYGPGSNPHEIATLACRHAWGQSVLVVDESHVRATVEENGFVYLELADSEPSDLARVI